MKQAACWIIFLQIVNHSINPPDAAHATFSHVPQKDGVASDETETIYEWVVEGLSGEEVPESDEEDMDTSLPSFELYILARIYYEPATSFPLQHFTHYHNTCPLVYKEPHSPPPKWV